MIALLFTLVSADYLLLDLRSGEVAAARWEQREKAIPVGSLVKPFTALAYAETHGYKYPRYTCTGCWLPAGHGGLDLPHAIAHSCNTYFERLAFEAGVEAVSRVAHRFGVDGPQGPEFEGALIGRGEAWKMAPEHVLRAYAELIARRADPGIAPLVDGMRLAGRIGTAAGAREPAWYKTGTAACTHRPRMPGDGFVVAVFPPEAPRWALLVRVHGVPGAEAARTAGEYIRLIQRGGRP